MCALFRQEPFENKQKADLALIRWQGHRPLNFVTAGRRSTICFTNGASFRHPRRVRKLAATSLLLLAVFSFARAQDQESKLVDRLLRPDMTLQNTAQKKSFIAAGGTSINKQATVGTFYVQEKSNSKGFSGTRGFSAQQFNSQSFPTPAVHPGFRHSKQSESPGLLMQLAPRAVPGMPL